MTISWSTRCIPGLRTTEALKFQRFCCPDIIRTSMNGGGRQSIRRTFERRPDLLEEAVLDKKEKQFLEQLKKEKEQGETE